ncbi:uncharacterized protein Z518_03522 [Rhinocladiella mackenziei CBS 650.93]|uniref:Aminoglycoside phosphotransferase domain-containing protein n=1 Tax=Rhinocladiella mackenziei CBS 650.93 TaxID=1442369 RepID=A0A0D2JHQ1_9EURO|nr:uncharacterized protein Z518_03522 [Rhinocladiella mackenziei CBS 650.93]KIX08865.1 hypothetical protein Z518_03522 [Rhinocladiella mackenziei CBS 650.93]
MAEQVRQPIDLKSLERYIDRTIPEIKTPLQVKQFGFGQSNPTYQLIAADRRKYVMRKKPPGQLLSKTAHQVTREFKVLRALEQTDVPAPKVYMLCEDDSVIGTAFYIMEFLDGRVITEIHFPNVSTEERTEMWRDAVRTLAKLHRVDFKKVGLSDFGRHQGFYDRQMKTFGNLSKVQAAVQDVDTNKRVGQIPYFDELASFLSDKSQQPADRATLIHGDYKIDNLIYHKTEPRVIGVLDWEMATIGHPLSDVVNLVSPWSFLDQVSQAARIAAGEPDAFSPGVTPGLPTLDQALKWYKEESGYNVAVDLAWGNAFWGFRSAIIVQGISARYAQRQASGKTAKQYVSQVYRYSDYAMAIVKELRDSSRSHTRL